MLLEAKYRVNRCQITSQTAEENRLIHYFTR